LVNHCAVVFGWLFCIIIKTNINLKILLNGDTAEIQSIPFKYTAP
jgi:hypothetical protein